MGQPKSQDLGGRHGSSSAEVLPLQPTHSAYDEEDLPDLLGEPPAYTDEDPSLQIPPVREDPIVKPIKNNHNGVDIFMDSRFDTDPTYAEECVRKWAKIPPSPLVQITGTHSQTVKKGDKTETETVTDFDIKLNLGPCLLNGPGGIGSSWMERRTAANNEKTYRGSCLKKRAPGPHSDVEVNDWKPSLREWCHRYCASHSPLKTFRFTRTVTGLDEEQLRRRILSLVHSTNYRGHARVRFPVDYGAVEVYSSHWINRWRWTPWICMIFYASFLWLLTWPALFVGTKRFHVVSAEWPFSRVDEHGRKRYATISEDMWFERWRVCIERAVLAKRVGFVTEEDMGRAYEPEREFRSGNGTVDAAVGFLSAGVRAYTEVNRQLGWGGDC